MELDPVESLFKVNTLIGDDLRPVICKLKLMQTCSVHFHEGCGCPFGAWGEDLKAGLYFILDDMITRYNDVETQIEDLLKPYKNMRDKERETFKEEPSLLARISELRLRGINPARFIGEKIEELEEENEQEGY